MYLSLYLYLYLSKKERNDSRRTVLGALRSVSATTTKGNEMTMTLAHTGDTNRSSRAHMSIPLATSKSTIDTALDVGALFEVKAEPMQVAGAIPVTVKGDPVRKILYRDTVEGPKVLNVVTANFPESNYLNVLETAEALFPDSCVSMKLIDGGERLVFTQSIGEAIDLGGGDTIEPNLIWTASLNSTWTTSCSGYGERFFCTNQLPLADTHIKVRRSRNHDQNLMMRSVILDQTTEAMKYFATKMSSLRSIQMSPTQSAAMIEGALGPRPEKSTRSQNHWDKKLAAISYFMGEEDQGPSAGTAFAVWNAIQSAETHVFTKGKNQEVKQTEMVVTNTQPLTTRFERRILATV